MSARTERLPPVQKISKQLLGARYRLEIAAWISESGSAPINPTELTEQLAPFSESPPRYTSVVQELNKLAESGLLVPLNSQMREVYFERRDSVFYEMCRRLREEVKQEQRAPST